MNIRGKDRGVSLVETMIAVLVAMIGVFGLGTLIFEATVTNKNQGTEVTRATIYAQDKMEKLLSLDFNACNQTVSTNPNYCDTSATWSSTGTALTGLTGSGWNTGLVTGGQLTTGDPSSPMQGSCPTSGLSVGYVDYLDSTGSQIPSTAGDCSTLTSAVAYVRMWQIQDVCESTSPASPAGCVGGPTGGPYVKQISVAVWSEAAVGGASTKPVVTITSYLSNSNPCSPAEVTAGCQD